MKAFHKKKLIQKLVGQKETSLGYMDSCFLNNPMVKEIEKDLKIISPTVLHTKILRIMKILKKKKNSF